MWGCCLFKHEKTFRFNFFQDLKGSISKLAQFVGKILPDDVIDGIAERVSFEGMKATYQQLEEKHGEEGQWVKHYKGIPHLRKGKITDQVRKS